MFTKLSIVRSRAFTGVSNATPTHITKAIPQLCQYRAITIPKPDHELVDKRQAPDDFCLNSAVVFKDIISEEDGASLVEDIFLRMKRRRYERDHWDSVITGYKEVELSHPHDMMTASNIPSYENITFTDYNGTLSEKSMQAISFIRNVLQVHFFSSNVSSLKWLPCHAIDLKKDGVLSAHVDSVKFSGDIVAGLSLKSSSIMRLKPDKDFYQSEMQGHVDLLLPPLSLYVLSGVGRYKYTHELLSSGETFSSSETQDAVKVTRDHRYSVIFRDAKDNT